MNHFIFHNVGQGLFYSGHLYKNNFNFIYDCGSESKRIYLHNAIDKQLPSQNIDFVVISHLHKDHISGLKRLVDNFNVKTIYLPYLGKGNSSLIKLLCVAAAFPESSADSNSIFDDFKEKYEFLESLYLEEKPEESKPKVVFNCSEETETNRSRYCYNNKIIDYRNLETSYWRFVMFNKRFNNSVLEKLNARIADLFQTTYSTTIEELLKKNEIKKIVAIYDKVFGHGKLNLTSTILVHYPIYNTNGYYIFNFSPYDYINKSIMRNNRILSILTGDVKFDALLLKNLKNELPNIKNSPSLFQVPHHGSRVNWDSLNGLKYAFTHYAISFGYKNRHHLPDPIVTTELKTMGKNDVSIVTEFSRFEYYIF